MLTQDEVESAKGEQPAEPASLTQRFIHSDGRNERKHDHHRQQRECGNQAQPHLRSASEQAAQQRRDAGEAEPGRAPVSLVDMLLKLTDSTQAPPEQSPEEQYAGVGELVLPELVSVGVQNL